MELHPGHHGHFDQTTTTITTTMQSIATACPPLHKVDGVEQRCLDKDDFVESIHISAHTPKLESNWIVDFVPYGEDDNFLLATKEGLGVQMFRSDSQLVIDLDGIRKCHTRSMAVGNRLVAQITDQSDLFLYSQDSIDDEIFSMLAMDSISVCSLHLAKH